MPILISLLSILLLTAVYSTGYYFGSFHMFEWKCRWVELERQLAELQQRKPRDPSMIENQPVKRSK